MFSSLIEQLIIIIGEELFLDFYEQKNMAHFAKVRNTYPIESDRYEISNPEQIRQASASKINKKIVFLNIRFQVLIKIFQEILFE
jgi:hypothetical protein